EYSRTGDTVARRHIGCWRRLAIGESTAFVRWNQIGTPALAFNARLAPLFARAGAPRSGNRCTPDVSKLTRADAVCADSRPTGTCLGFGTAKPAKVIWVIARSAQSAGAAAGR